MPRTVRLEVNQAGMRELLKSPKVTAHLQKLGARVAAAMEAGAPVESGTLAGSHRVEVVERPTRTVVQVGSDVDYALPVALKTGYMARAIDAAGGA